MNSFDIIIVGGGTAGCACAYTAGKYGLKVLLIEKNSFLGGSITSSLVIPAMKTSENSINNDFFNTLYNELAKVNGAITYSDGNKGWFNPELTKIILDKLLFDANVKVLFESYIDKIEDNLLSYNVTICSNNISCFNKELLPCIETKSIVDATGDAFICKMLNCEFLDENLTESNNSQPINLRFIMSGIDTNKFANWLTEYDKDHNVTSTGIYTYLLHILGIQIITGL